MQLAKTAFLPNPGFPLNLGVHVFSASNDGQLVHEIDGTVRAVVPPEGWRDYVSAWPDAASVTAALTKAPAAPVAVAKARKKR